MTASVFEKSRTLWICSVLLSARRNQIIGNPTKTRICCVLLRTSGILYLRKLSSGRTSHRHQQSACRDTVLLSWHPDSKTSQQITCLVRFSKSLSLFDICSFSLFVLSLSYPKHTSGQTMFLPASCSFADISKTFDGTNHVVSCF